VSLLEGILLGIVQGLTELLPVSSSAHLVFAQSLIEGFRQPGVLFDVMLHVGTTVAVALFFRREIGEILLALLPEGYRRSLWGRPDTALNDGWVATRRRFLLYLVVATAITGAIAAGINVNATLIFSIERYAGVMDAYLKGLERRAAAGLPLDRVASVASFFVSRVDTKIDGLLAGMMEHGGAQADKAASLLGKAAVANAKLAYASFQEVLGGPRFLALKAKGARAQRPLWASTGTKNKAYSDVLYVDELIGPHTVNTVPPATLAAFLDHGTVRPGCLMEKVDEARQQTADLEMLGVSFYTVTGELEQEGVRAFADAFAALLDAVEASCRKALA